MVAPAAAEGRFERFERDLDRVAKELQIFRISAAIEEDGKVVWGSRTGSVAPDSAEFHQTYSGERIVWTFGQNNGSSSLTLSVPQNKLTLIVEANSRAMAAYLEDGNVARSAIALAFLKDVAGVQVSQSDEMVDRAVTALYLGQRDQSATLIRETLNKYPELESADDVSLLHLLAELRLPATESVATVALMKHPDLPAAWLYYGRYLRAEKRFREATACFKQITEHQPPWNHWSVTEAKKELSTLE